MRVDCTYRKRFHEEFWESYITSELLFRHNFFPPISAISATDINLDLYGRSYS